MGIEVNHMNGGYSMKVDFKKYINEALDARIEEILVFVAKGPKYKSMSRRSAKLQNEIIKCLKDDSDLLDQYEGTNNLQQYITFSRLYRQGWIDGIRFSRLCGKVTGSTVRNRKSN
jgi:hypothetical protein